MNTDAKTTVDGAGILKNCATTGNSWSDNVDIRLPKELSEQATLYASLYNFQTGGYKSAIRAETPVLTPEICQHYWASIPSEQEQYDSVELEVALFLYNIVKMTQARRVIETGTSRGFSSSFLAAALQGRGMLITIDPADILHLWDKADLDRVIQWIPAISTTSDTLDKVKTLLSGAQADLIFLDSLHSYENLITEISVYERLLRLGGTFVLHDTLFYDCLAPVVHQMMKESSL